MSKPKSRKHKSSEYPKVEVLPEIEYLDENEDRITLIPPDPYPTPEMLLEATRQ